MLVLSHCNLTNCEQVSAHFSPSDWRTALHIAAFLGNVVILQLLLWVGLSTASVVSTHRHYSATHGFFFLQLLFLLPFNGRLGLSDFPLDFLSPLVLEEQLLG